jgi:creatinine amidohydrolase
MLLQEMTSPEIGNLSRDIPVLVPVAALEQHGRHMPVFTDSMLLGEVVRRVGEAMKDRVLIAPVMWLGNSHHHLDFQGTLSASPRVYLDLLNDLAENVIAHGFRRIVFINGHGGNATPGKQAVFEIRQRHRDRSDLLLLFGAYWDQANPNDGRPDLVQSEMGHACEWETSMMLRLAPQLVRDHTRAASVPFGFGFEPAYRGWVTKDRTVPGHIGHPQEATADKGEYLFATYAAGVIKLLERIIAWDGKSWEMP